MSEHIELIDALGALLDEQRRTTDAVIQLAEALAGIKSATKVKPTNPTVELAADIKKTVSPGPEPTPTPIVAPLEMLMTSMVAYSKHADGGKANAKDLLKKYNAGKVSDVAESDRAKLISEINEVIA